MTAYNPLFEPFEKEFRETFDVDAEYSIDALGRGPEDAETVFTVLDEGAGILRWFLKYHANYVGDKQLEELLRQNIRRGMELNKEQAERFIKESDDLRKIIKKYGASLSSPLY